MAGTAGVAGAARRRWAWVAAGVAALTGLLPTFTPPAVAGGGRTPAPVELTPPFAHVDQSMCDDGGGSIRCNGESHGREDGYLVSEATVDPVRLPATGRALGQGLLRGDHRILRPVPALRYTITFEYLLAMAYTYLDPGIECPVGTMCSFADEQVPEAVARGFIGGYVFHPRCPACTTVVYEQLVDSDPLSSPPDSQELAERKIVVEVRNPAGAVPRGTLEVYGLVRSVAGPMSASQPTFISYASAHVGGDVTGITAEVLPS